MNEEINKHDLVKRTVDKLDGTRIVVGGNKEFYKSLYHLQYTQEIVNNVLTAFLRVMEDELGQGNTIKLIGYFTAKPEFRKSRKARNVYTNEEVIIPDGYTLKIKGGKKLKEACERYSTMLTEEDTGDEEGLYQ